MTPPPMPEDISAFVENGRLVYRAGTRSLYVYDNDQPGRSNCDGLCARTWPPLEPSPQAAPVGEWTLLARTDASRQWAYKGRPIYLYSRDEDDQASGDGVDGLWHIVKP